jgi:hypothetical protein
LTQQDADELIKLAKDRNVVQIGAYCGRATIALAQVAKRLWVLEDFRYPGGTDAVVEELKRNVKEAGVDERISFLYGDGLAFKPFNDLPHDVALVYRDANRLSEHEENDQLLALNLLGTDGGVYAWHGEAGFKWMRVAAEMEAVA